MARTATARAGKGKGTVKAKRGTKPTPPLDIQTPAKKKTRPPKGQGKAVDSQVAFLAKVKAENPLITSEEFALKFRVPVDEVVRMRHFLSEYLRDFDLKASALRMGYPTETATETGRLLLYHSYTQIRLLELLDRMEVAQLVNASQIISRLWKEANLADGLFNNAPNRIAALKTLARIIGLDLPKPKDDGKPKGPSGGVMIVPMAVSPDQWGEYAAASQRALKESTAIDV